MKKEEEKSENSVLHVQSNLVISKSSGPEFFLTFTLSVYVLFDLILYVPSTIFQLNRDGSPWVEPALS